MMIYEYALYADIWKIVIWRNLMTFSAAYNTGRSPSKNNLRCSVGKGHAYLLFQLCYIYHLGLDSSQFFCKTAAMGCSCPIVFPLYKRCGNVCDFADVFATPTLLYIYRCILKQPITNIISPSEHRFQKKGIVNNHLPVSCSCQLVFKVEPPLIVFRQKNYHLKLSCADWKLVYIFAAQKWMDKNRDVIGCLVL